MLVKPPPGAELPVHIVHDLLADSWTNSGLFYEEAFSWAIASKEASLAEAQMDLSEALMCKHNWIPAQTYLAQVFQAQGKTLKQGTTDVHLREWRNSVVGLS
jgi:hypothetical protein